MEVKELSELLNKNFNKLFTPNRYKHILNRGNNLIRLDIVNRMLVELQYDNAFDLRTSDEWLLENRGIVKKEKPIYLIIPKYKYEYIDKETGKTIDNKELSIGEINKAIEYNIIERVDTIDNMYTIPVFDIRQTYSLDKSKYNINKPIISSKKLLEIMHNITMCNIEICEDTYYSKSDNILYLKKQPYSELVITISEYLAQYYIDNDLKKLIDIPQNISYKDLTEYDIDLIKQSLIFAIVTLLGGKIDINFDIINYTTNDKAILILNIVDSMLIEISTKLKFTNTSHIMDVSSNINMLKKAEALLDIMEANNINKIMKGA